MLKRYRSVEGLCLVEVAEGRREDVRKRYAAELQVLYAQDDHVIHAFAVPNDPSFPVQWGLRNTGQTVPDLFGGDDPGTPGADIRAEGAWDLTTGDAAIRIAVLDSGVDYNHPDLAANIWTNTGETGFDKKGNPKETNGIDDDGNLWIDDVHGYDFVNHDGDPMDDYFHGTHVAGIIGAVGNNGVGVTGVNWQCQIVALKILDATGSGFDSDAIEAMDYLIDNGILLSNNSWGCICPFNPALSDAVGELQAIGHLFVAAAGPFFGRNIDEFPVYPASFDFQHMIVVAGVDNDDLLSIFSDIGPISVDLAAPGDNVWSTLPGASYGLATGTSMAAPHVTGTAALLWGRRPELSWSDVHSRLLRSVRVVPALIGRTVTGGIIDASVAVGDCNHNGVPDEQDIAQGGSDDCNSDGFPDECELDCNVNGVADACDIDPTDPDGDGFVSEDCNGNGVPDECELDTGSSEDCNGNAVPDECDIVSGGSEDLNGTGVPDECESCSVDTDCDDVNACTDDSCADGLCFWFEHTQACDDGDICTIGDVCQSGVCVGTPVPDSGCLPVLSMAAVAINGDAISGGPLSEVTVTRGDRLTLEMFARNWTPQEVSLYQVTIDSAGYTSGTTGSLSPLIDPTPDAGAFIEQERPDFMFFGRTSLALVDFSDPSGYRYGGLVPSDEDCAFDTGGPAYLGTLVLDIGQTAVGRFQMCLDEDIGSFLGECADPLQPNIAPILFECLTILAPPDDCTPGEDCNGNGSWDICDITDGTSEDCDENDIPDECDLDPTDPDGDGFVSDDCNGNGVADDCDIAGGWSGDCDGNGLPDECDIDLGFSDDCNGNGVPDECEPDCNGNGIQDTCDIDSGFSEDCSGNGVPDECEPDCNGNGIQDTCDIDSGFSADCNGNGVPEECDAKFASTVNYAAGNSPYSVAIGDLDGDQVPDLAVANNRTHNISVLLGGGDGTFVAAVHYPAGNQPLFVAIRDLDGDQVRADAL
ncbi:MAG: S8 family serine peptidase, partial [Planctomycetes bacterium]|nr:S8 family serine peptidase [Planctomycetota bacterium]